MGYAMVAAVTGGWVYLVVGLRWLVNTVWNIIIVIKSRDNIPARLVIIL